MNRFTQLFVSILLLGSLTVYGGCEDKAPAPSKSSGSAPATDKHDGHDHAAGDKHDHDHGHDNEGPSTDLGSATIGVFQVKAERFGDFKPGDDAPVEVRLTPSGTSKASAVRAWFGTQDAKGSVKAKMEMEKDHYHSHVEIPGSLPDGSKLWVEIEDEKGAKAVGSFDIKK